MVNSLPAPGPGLPARTLPPCISTRCLTSVRPMPSPPCDRSSVRSTCVNISKIRGSISGGMPTPLSRTLTDTSAWVNSHVIDGDIIDTVKREPRDVIISASLSIVHTLIAGDLIDEYRLLTFPTIVGSGERLFPAGSPPAYLECLSAERVGAVVLARYARAAR